LKGLNSFFINEDEKTEIRRKIKEISATGLVLF
jgi:hypothetical protein